MSTWTIDPDHSVAAFAVKHLKIAHVRGQFNTLQGTIEFDPKDIAATRAEATIGTAGLLTGIRKRDEHVMSPDFIEAASYPHIVFRSTAVEPLGPGKARMTGDLTIRNITKQVVLAAEFSGPVKSPFGGEITMGFTATTVIDRFDFGVTWNELMEDGGLMIGREVQIILDIEADLQQ